MKKWIIILLVLVIFSIGLVACTPASEEEEYLPQIGDEAQPQENGKEEGNHSNVNVKDQSLAEIDESKWFLLYNIHPSAISILVEDGLKDWQLDNFTGFETALIDHVGELRITGDIMVVHDIYSENYDPLSDPDKLDSFLRENGIGEYEDIRIFDMDEFIEGFVVYVVAGPDAYEDAYFIPFIKNGNEYGGFENGRVYTREEFIKQCGPKEASFIVCGTDIQDGSKPIMQYVYTQIPLEPLLRSIGMAVTWDEATKTMYFGEYSLLVDEEKNPNGDIKKGRGVLNEGYGGYRIIDDTVFIVGMNIVNVSNEFGLVIRYDYDKHVVTVTKRG